MVISSVALSSASVTVAVSSDDGSGTETFLLSPGEWKRLNLSLGYDPDEGLSLPAGQPLDEPAFESLKTAGERTAAVRDAASLLSFANRSRAALLSRLIERGHSPEAAEHAVSFLEKKWLLNDAASCRAVAENAVRTRHVGPLRVIAFLVSHGYARQDAEQAAASIPPEAYREALLRQIEKRCPALAKVPCPLSPTDRKKAAAALMRQGFSAGEIRDALRELHKAGDF